MGDIFEELAKIEDPEKKGQFIFDYFADETWIRWLGLSGLDGEIDVLFLRFLVVNAFLQCEVEKTGSQRYPSKGNSKKPLEKLQKHLNQITSIIEDPTIGMILGAAHHDISDNIDLEFFLFSRVGEQVSQEKFKEFPLVTYPNSEELEIAQFMNTIKMLQDRTEQALNILPDATKPSGFESVFIRTFMECWHYLKKDFPAISPESNLIVLVHDILKESYLREKNTIDDPDIEKRAADALVKQAQGIKKELECLPPEAWELLYDPFRTIPELIKWTGQK